MMKFRVEAQTAREIVDWLMTEGLYKSEAETVISSVVGPYIEVLKQGFRDGNLDHSDIKWLETWYETLLTGARTFDQSATSFPKATHPIDPPDTVLAVCLKMQAQQMAKLADWLSAGALSVPSSFLTVTEAAKLTGVDKGTITRAVNKGLITSNGKNGANRRVDSVSVRTWAKRRSRTFSAPTPSHVIDLEIQKMKNKTHKTRWDLS